MLTVDVTVKTSGDFTETVFELPDGRVLVTTSVDEGWAGLFRSRGEWEHAQSDYDALEAYDSVSEAFADVV